jgi:hypothetical protein
MTAKPHELAQLAISAESNKADEQEFYNSKLGLPHVVKGGQVSDTNIDECTKNYSESTGGYYGMVTMGIDVGAKLDYEIDMWFLDDSARTVDVNAASHCKLIAEGTVDEFTDLDKLMRDFGVVFAIIDREPETREAMKFACRFPDRVALCKYGSGVSGRVLRYNKDDAMVLVDRTVWMDTSLGRFIADKKGIRLPIDLSERYKQHVCAPARVYKKDAQGVTVGKWITGDGVADHQAHARTYAEIALPFAACLSRNEDITKVYGD